MLASLDKDMRTGMLALMAVVHLIKNKVQPVLDYRELNKYIMYLSGGEFSLF